MKIAGLDKPVLTPRGEPFEQGGQPIIFGDALYSATSIKYQGQPDAHQALAWKVAKKLGIPYSEIEITSEEATMLKDAIKATSTSNHFTGTMHDLIESGGIQ